VKVATNWLTHNDGTHPYKGYQQWLIPLSTLQHGPVGVLFPASAERKQGTPTHKRPNMSYFRSMSGLFNSVVFCRRNAPLRDPNDMHLSAIFRAVPSIMVPRNSPPVPLSWVSPFKTCWSSKSLLNRFLISPCSAVMTQQCSIDKGLAYRQPKSLHVLPFFLPV